jgi:hypothetical protein
MKKLSMNEMNVVSSVIREKINEIKYEKIKGKLEKDVDFKKLEKIKKEIDELNKKIKEKNNLSNEINLKIRNKYDIGNVYIDNNNEVKVMFNNNNSYNKINNEIILMNMSREFNIDEMINKLVEKLS